MLVSEAAKQLGMSTQTLRLALRQGLFDFGTAVKTSENRWTYYVNPARLHRYLEGTDYEKANHCGNDGGLSDTWCLRSTNHS